VSGGPVLLCYDGSDDARRAIEEAGRLLRPGGATVVTVWQRVTYAINTYGAAAMAAPDTTKVDHGLEQTAARQAAEGADLARTAGFDAEPATVEAVGPFWDTLLRTADERDATMIVLGSRGLSGIKSVLLGSVSHGVAQHSPRPVLIVPPAAESG
jgi:nucleotide-binding universal stress UspA family protein